MRYLADTSVLSALSPASRGNDSAAYGQWVIANAHLIAIPVFAVMEIEQGIRKLFRSGAIAKANSLALWLERLLGEFADRIVDFDVRSAMAAAAMADRLISTGRHPGFSDVCIAATAQARGLIVVTRNLRHFHETGVTSIDPFMPRSSQT